jgi:non-heme chloroperoxidase
MNARQLISFFTLLTVALGFPAKPDSEWTDKSPHKIQFLTANSIKLQYLDWGGKGDTILFLHGLGRTSHIFDDLAPKLTNQCRVLGLTWRGHGKSDMPDTGYDTATLVEDIRQFLDALKINRVILAGHSIAGDQLTRFAAVYPDRVLKLVYLDAAADRAGLPEVDKHFPQELSSPGKNDLESLENCRRWISRTSVLSQAMEADLREMFGPDGKIIAGKRGKVMGLLFKGSIESHPVYTKIRCPALSFAVVGLNSKLLELAKGLPDSTRAKWPSALTTLTQWQEKEIDRFRKEIPNGRVIVFTNTDHYCFIERETEVVSEMRQFLAH